MTISVSTSAGTKSTMRPLRPGCASGIGITVLPTMAQPPSVLDGSRRDDGLLAYVPFEPPPPTRRVVLAWRRSFTRVAAIEALRDAVLRADLPGVRKLGVVPSAPVGAPVADAPVADAPVADAPVGGAPVAGGPVGRASGSATGRPAAGTPEPLVAGAR